MKLKKQNKQPIGVIDGNDFFKNSINDKKSNDFEIKIVKTRNLEIKKIKAFENNEDAIEVIKSDNDKNLKKRRIWNILHVKLILFFLILIILFICLFFIYKKYNN